MNKIFHKIITLSAPSMVSGVAVLCAIYGVYAPTIGLAAMTIVLINYYAEYEASEAVGDRLPSYPRRDLLVAAALTIAGLLL